MPCDALQPCGSRCPRRGSAAWSRDIRSPHIRALGGIGLQRRAGKPAPGVTQSCATVEEMSHWRDVGYACGDQPGSAAGGPQPRDVARAGRSTDPRGRAVGPRRGQGLGAIAGGAQAQRWGELADRNRPILHTHDRYGHRIDEIEFDPAYHELMRTAIGHGLHAAPWADDRPGAHVVRAAKILVWNPEPGHVCPISATYAVVPSLRYNAELAKVYEPLLTSREYDPELKPATTKVGITSTMSMTEKQGGSDLRAGTTRATPNADGSYPWSDTSGSPRRRCLTSSWCWPRLRAGYLASCCRGCCPTAAATGCSSSGLRTSSAITPTRPVRSNTTAPQCGWWARRGAACQPSSRWSTSPGWTAPWPAPPACTPG